jgi:hypothetical protein
MLRPAPCRREGGGKGTSGLTLGPLTGHNNRAELGCSKNNPGTLRHRVDRGFTGGKARRPPEPKYTSSSKEEIIKPAAWLTARHEAGGRGTVL